MKNIHITGGNGFIGSNLFNTMKNYFNVSRSDIDTVNILSLAEINAFFKNQGFDTVIHVAGLMGNRQQNKLCIFQ